MGPDSAGQLLRFFFIRIRNNVRVVLERDLRITTAHELRYDVNRRSGFEQTCRYAVPEAVDADVRVLRRGYPEPSHCPMQAVFHDIIGEVWPADGVGEQVALRIGSIAICDRSAN